MSILLIFAIISITLALVFYTIGVCGEHRAKVLRKKHVIIFWLGLVLDTLGTTAMSKIAKTANASGNEVMIHGITGALAIILMLIHAVWASYVLYKNDEKMKKIFHKFSLVVWFIWLVPYLVGAFMGMAK
ncbi:TIGR03987 family protein [Clostridium cavendishii DSM 21758]|uniref:TIGR03987 family protein n=1 Tax=Clostridium cavendishii DSM 21758 TaxID=1121302 RepID=A0A1M6PQV5_9CLOT|nr:HsmA family protein [Clostridium cavendishii]SHK10354.1 TIGR03987 family protein [Clostridium cavendishii DSM 21758]